VTDVSPESEGAQNGSTTGSKNAPTQKLPTPRIAFQRQLEILRAYAAKSDEGKRSVTNEEVAGIVGMSKDTITLGNAFFADVGVLTRTEGGYLPAPEVVNYLRVHQWSPEKAAHELAPKLAETWFAKVLLPRLAVNKSMNEDEALTELAKASSAATSYKPQLETLLEYLEVAGLLVRDNGQLQTAGLFLGPEGPPKPPGDASAPSAPPAISGRTGPATGQLPLLVQGLLQQLPNDKWDRDGVEAWIKLARNIFDVVYDLPPATPGSGSP
jgi:hypothetical protein